MRFLLHPVPRTAAARATRKKAGGEKLLQKHPLVVSSVASSSAETVAASSRTISSEMKKSWGQQCSPNCGCVVRFETTVDPVTQRIIEAKYHAKEVLTTVSKSDSGYLTPVYTTRTYRPMFQECKCDTVHALSQKITSYLPNKRLDHIRGMNDFTYTRSSPAFRHAVLAENNLPRHHTHCFDLVEEAFTGMINNSVPARRKINAEYQKLLKAEYLEQPVVVRSYYMGGSSNGNTNQFKDEYVHPKSAIGSLGADKTRFSLSSSRTMNTLRMFDINAEHWDDEEHSKEAAKQQSRRDRFDWVSYVDEQYESKESA
ncbi:hypothetical protein IV203_005586 [Nitzschia inconspicua]|uniref:Uncharacterized protein n=1 Tax=Nitzschia inconspicua TaxID=303405 RepID=A0A9K3KP47_9STRA|nr:hypothetical protein IV203_005580 [Nitzschia inconspicua]KAG7346518.1 hypothetical protein IV203_005586 [Nitzschia inconspicua]